MLFSPCLPQNEPLPFLRFARLELARDQYQYSYTLIDGVAMAATVPFEALPSLTWLRLIGQVIIDLLTNNSSADQGQGRAGLMQAERKTLNSASDQGGTLALVNVSSLLKDLASQLAVQRAVGDGNSFAEYEDLFATIPLPPISQILLEDSLFARLRLAGYNPAVLQRIDESQAREIFSAAVLVTGIDTDRLFLADYTLFAGLSVGNQPVQKFFWAPQALFSIVSGKLAPIAILIPGLAKPLFTPPASGSETDWGWQMAKVAVQIADANHHELVSHLALTHLITEAFVLATNRQLAPNHPLSILLSPHFEGTLNINNLAQAQLIADGGPVDQLLALQIATSRSIAVQAVQQYRFNASLFPKDLERRGVADPAVLPDYPYRSDGLVLWQAIYTWVADYLALYYPDDSTVQADSELQVWIAELASPSGGRLQDIGENGAIRTRAYLCDLVTQIIFTASVQHAAVNFTQASIMAYAPAAPLAGYSSLPDAGSSVTEQQFFDLLPSRDQARSQLNVLHLLGSVYYTTLGKYPAFLDTRVQPPLQRFQLALQQIEQTIVQRNSSPEGLLQPVYDVLRPSRIPQSTNI